MMTIQPAIETNQVIRSGTSYRYFIAIVFAVFLIYLPSLFVPFYFDDYNFIIDNPNIKDFSHIPQLLKEYFYVRGWVQITLAFDWWLYNGKLCGIHLTNIILHLLNSFVVFFLANKIIRNLWDEEKCLFAGSRLLPAGWICALLFAVHPVQTESVTYIITRSELIASLGYFLAMWGSAVLLEKKVYIPSGFQSWFLNVGITIIVCAGLAFGIGAKETILSLPAPILLYQYLLYKKKNHDGFWIDAIIIYAPMVLMFCVYLFMRYRAIGSILGFQDVLVRTPWVNVMTQCAVIVQYYFPRLFIPVNLNIDPQITEIHSLLTLPFCFSITVLLGCVITVFYCIRKSPLLSFSISWFFITIAISSSFIPLNDLAADHRLYLPLLGFALLMEYFIVQGLGNHTWHRMNAGIILLLFILFMVITITKNMEYTSPVLFWRNSAILSPAKFRPMRNFGGALIEYKQSDEALKLYTGEYKGVRADGRNYGSLDDIEFTLSVLYSKGKAYPKLIQMIEQLSLANPASIPHLELLQKAYLLSGQYDQLQTVVDKTSGLQPNNKITLKNKAFLFLQNDKVDEALSVLEYALQNYPGDSELLEKIKKLYVKKNRNTDEIDKRIGEIQSKSKNYKTQFEFFVPSR